MALPRALPARLATVSPCVCATPLGVPSLAMPGKDHPLLVSVPLSDPVVTRSVGLIRRKGRSLTPSAQQLYDFLLEMKPGMKAATGATSRRKAARAAQ